MCGLNVFHLASTWSSNVQSYVMYVIIAICSPEFLSEVLLSVACIYKWHWCCWILKGQHKTDQQHHLSTRERARTPWSTQFIVALLVPILQPNRYLLYQPHSIHQRWRPKWASGEARSIGGGVNSKRSADSFITLLSASTNGQFRQQGYCCCRRCALIT